MAGQYEEPVGRGDYAQTAQEASRIKRDEDRSQEVPAQIETYGSHVDRIEHQMGRLVERLGVVSRPEPDSSAPGLATATFSPFGGSLQVLNHRLGVVIERLIDQIDRLEV